MSECYFDDRWCAPHGIGRFATEVRRRLSGLSDLALSGSPTSPLDPVRLARYLRSRGAGGYFSPGFNVPAWARCPVISTIHDLIHVHFCQERSPAKAAYYRLVQRPIVRRSPVTLTVSEYSRGQIIQWYDVPESRVVCVGNGVSEEFTEHGETYNSERPYFLYVGNTKPHKNVETLLQATARLCDRGGCDDVGLILVAKPSEKDQAKIAELGLEQRVTILSGIDDSKLATIYRAAIALVMPSHYEGFGLPMVEAMSCGCPVIGSDRTSIPEVLGGAGELFDPHCPDELADKMRMLLEQDDHRSRLRKQGIERSRAFSWDSVASKVRDSITPHLAG